MRPDVHLVDGVGLHILDGAGLDDGEQALVGPRDGADWDASRGGSDAVATLPRGRVGYRRSRAGGGSGARPPPLPAFARARPLE